jgi:hypothetical protein
VLYALPTSFSLFPQTSYHFIQEDIGLQQNNFTCCLVRVRNSVSYIKPGTYAVSQNSFMSAVFEPNRKKAEGVWRKFHVKGKNIPVTGRGGP